MTNVRLISWNVNGIRAIHKKGFLDWFNEEKADTEGETEAVTQSEKEMAAEAAAEPKNEEATKALLKYCKDNGLFISGGSDCHGTFAPGRNLGEPEVHIEQLYLPGLL